MAVKRCSYLPSVIVFAECLSECFIFSTQQRVALPSVFILPSVLENALGKDAVCA
jgi:hypothetical protein